MGARTIVLLLVLVLGLGAILFFTDEKPKVDVVAEAPILDGRSLAEAKRIWWQFPDHAPLEISRTEKGLQLTEPYRDAVSPGYLRQIVTAWDSARMRATPLRDDDDGRKQAELSPPSMRMIVEYVDGARYEIDLGGQGPLGSTRFLRLHGKIWEGGTGLIESMRVGADELRDHAVFRNQAQTVGELRVEQLLPSGKREAIHLKREKGEWRLLEPCTGRSDPATTQRFLTSVLGLRVDDFVPGVTRLPTEEPPIVVVARGAQGEETARLWVRDGQIFGMLPGRDIVFTSDNRQYGAIFENAVNELRARMLVSLQSVYQEMTEVVVDPGQGRGIDRLRLSRDGSAGEWKIIEPLQYPADPTAVSELSQAINNLYAVEFVTDGKGVQAKSDDPAFGLGAGRLQLTVRGEKDPAPIVLWLGADVTASDGPRTYACRADETQNVVLVDRRPVDRIRQAWIGYCALPIVSLNLPIVRLDLARRDTGARRKFVRRGDHWVLDGADAARDEVGEFANDVLRDLHGKRAVDVRDPAFAAADWTLALSRDNGDELVLLRVFDRGPDRPIVVQRSNAPVGFEVGALVDTQLRALWQ